MRNPFLQSQNLCIKRQLLFKGQLAQHRARASFLWSFEEMEFLIRFSFIIYGLRCIALLTTYAAHASRLVSQIPGVRFRKVKLKTSQIKFWFENCLSALLMSNLTFPCSDDEWKHISRPAPTSSQGIYILTLKLWCAFIHRQNDETLNWAWARQTSDFRIRIWFENSWVLSFEIQWWNLHPNGLVNCDSSFSLVFLGLVSGASVLEAGAGVMLSHVAHEGGVLILFLQAKELSVYV